MKIGFGVASLVLLAAGAVLAAGTGRGVDGALRRQEHRGLARVPEGRVPRGRAGPSSPTAASACTRGSKAGDLMTRKQFGDFELAFEWKVAEGANSGILYRFPEIPGKPAYRNAFEYQILDDAEAQGRRLPHPPGRRPLRPLRRRGRRAAARGPVERIPHRGPGLPARALAERPARRGLRPPERRLQGSAWPRASSPPGRASASTPKGHIALQEHGDDVWFRNIRIREIH